MCDLEGVQVLVFGEVLGVMGLLQSFARFGVRDFHPEGEPRVFRGLACVCRRAAVMGGRAVPDAQAVGVRCARGPMGTARVGGSALGQPSLAILGRPGDAEGGGRETGTFEGAGPGQRFRGVSRQRRPFY